MSASRLSPVRPGVAPPWPRLLLVGALVALAACTATTRYSVLSFFFDGVPDPNAPPAVVQQRTSGPMKPADRSATRPAPQGSVHVPYSERRCSECHAGSAGAKKGVAMDLGAFSNLRRPAEELCVSCHAQPARRFEHAPILLGDCARCHHPHASQHRALLRRARVRDLCVECHNSDTMVDPGHHAGTEARDCSTCHDPHGGDERNFLRPPSDSPDAGMAPTVPPASPPPPQVERPQSQAAGAQSGGSNGPR